MSRFWKTVAAVMAAALSVTLVPGQGRCDDMPRANVILMVIELGRPKKPECAKPVAQPASPCCPGAGAMPCCPMAQVTSIPCQGPSTCTVCPVPKPEAVAAPCVHGPACVPYQCPSCPMCPMCPHVQVETLPAPCCVKPCCEQSGCCKAEHALAEMRFHFAEQARVLHELQTMIKDLRTTVLALQGQIQTLQANQLGVPVPCKVPVQGGMAPYDVPMGSHINPLVNGIGP
jgi:hypothetical protein